MSRMILAGRILAVITFVGTGAWLAAAQPTTCTSEGVDLIMADLYMANYTAADGFDAFAVGTQTCNIGSQPSTYVANSPAHPVIAAGMYKLYTVDGATRFEQIGMSWAFHDYLPIQQALCCACQAGGSGQLGAGCSNSHTASGQGAQAGLGPRWQIDAWTGTFPYPPANPGFSGSTARRLRAALTDLQPSGPAVRYFVDSQIVSADDSAAENQDNNASYRQVTVNGTSDFFAIATGAAVREQAAIRAWGANDVGVVEREVRVPDEGYFIVAAKATNLGSGLWRYEYAVQNVNSHRAARSLSIPVPAGINIANAGFHDVAYHSGDGPNDENIDGTDWVALVGGGAITWEMQPVPLEEASNALRWGTMYNFRFDADMAPGAGAAATIGLFRAGSPAEITTGLLPTPGGVAGDVDSDGDVDLGDLTLLLASYGACAGDPQFNGAADFDGSGCVELGDLAVLLANFGS